MFVFSKQIIKITNNDMWRLNTEKVFILKFLVRKYILQNLNIVSLNEDCYWWYLKNPHPPTHYNQSFKHLNGNSLSQLFVTIQFRGGFTQ